MVGTATVNEEPIIFHDGNIQEVLEEKFTPPLNSYKRIDELGVGDSHMFLLKPNRSEDTVRVRRLPDFALNVVLFDSFAKEPVLVTNGRCLLNHESPEGYAATHANGCVFVQDEAIALRPFVDMSLHGAVRVGFTYRAVNAAYLETMTDDNADAAKQQFDAVMGGGKHFGKVRAKRFIGRV